MKYAVIAIENTTEDRAHPFCVSFLEAKSPKQAAKKYWKDKIGRKETEFKLWVMGMGKKWGSKHERMFYG